MNFFKKSFVALSVVFLLFVLCAPALALAQGATGDSSGGGATGDSSGGGATGDSSPDYGTIDNPIEADSVQGLIKTLLIGIIKIGIPIIALAIIYSGFLFVFARGNSEKLSEAKRALLYTAIGAGLILGAWALAQLISDTVLAL